MYATFTLMPVKSGMREKYEKVADNQFSFAQGLKGFISATYLFNPEGSECGGFMIWESKEDADAAWAIAGPKIQEAMADLATGPPTRKVFDVYEPKT